MPGEYFSGKTVSLVELNRRVFAATCDVTQPDKLRQAVNNAHQLRLNIGIVIANPGFGVVSNAEDLTPNG